MAIRNNDNGQRLINDGILHVQGFGYRQLIKSINSFSMRESGKGLEYYATIQELQKDQDYLISFHGRMPLDSLTDLVWELHDDDEGSKRTVRAYTSCNRYGLPANAMLCMDEKIDDADVIAVDSQDHVYVIDYENESLDYTYITPLQRERVAVITDKDVDDDSAWIEWRYIDDNNSFEINDDDIHNQFQVGDTCLVDWRHGVMGWPVVRGVAKK